MTIKELGAQIRDRNAEGAALCDEKLGAMCYTADAPAAVALVREMVNRADDPVAIGFLYRLVQRAI